MKFGPVHDLEFAEVVILAAITTAVFFGGWHLPLWDNALGAWLTSTFREWPRLMPIVAGALYSTIFWVKVVLLCYVQLAIRWTFPRFRYDQIQTLGWKILPPARPGEHLRHRRPGAASTRRCAGWRSWDCWRSASSSP